MPKFAQFDSNGDVVAWYDTDCVPLESYKEPPPASTLVIVSDAQWAKHTANGSGKWAVQKGTLVGPS